MIGPPKRIWADSTKNQSGEWDWDSGAWGHLPEQDGEVEYTRSDLVPKWRPISEYKHNAEGMFLFVTKMPNGAWWSTLNPNRADFFMSIIEMPCTQ